MVSFLVPAIHPWLRHSFMDGNTASPSSCPPVSFRYSVMTSMSVIGSILPLRFISSNLSVWWALPAMTQFPYWSFAYIGTGMFLWSVSKL